MTPSDLAREAKLAIPNDGRIVVIASAGARGVGGCLHIHFGGLAESMTRYPRISLTLNMVYKNKSNEIFITLSIACYAIIKSI